MSHLLRKSATIVFVIARTVPVQRWSTVCPDFAQQNKIEMYRFGRDLDVRIFYIAEKV